MTSHNSEDTTALAQSESPTACTAGTTHLVIVAEDDPALQRLLTQVLEDEGYEVRTAADGATILDLLSAHEPSLVLLDLSLPALDGMQVAAAYQELCVPRRAPILFVSGTVSAPELPPGVVGFIAKPFDLDDIVFRVADTIAQHSRSAPDGGPRTPSSVRSRRAYE